MSNHFALGDLYTFKQKNEKYVVNLMISLTLKFQKRIRNDNVEVSRKKLSFLKTLRNLFFFCKVENY